MARERVSLYVHAIVLRRHACWVIFMLSCQPSTSTKAPNWPEPSPYVRVHAGARKLAGSDLTKGIRASASEHGGDNARDLDIAVRSTPICIVWKAESAGELGSSILYRARRIDSDTIQVGYFVFWTTERPWGDNFETRWVLPALAIDAVYTRLFFVLPGLQSMMYGDGDIEGARVTFRRDDRNRFRPVSIAADHGAHKEAIIDVRDAVDERGRLMLLSEAWSHQLGGRGAVSAFQAGAETRCYEQDALRPLTSEVAAAFRLGTAAEPRRAAPAWRF